MLKKENKPIKVKCECGPRWIYKGLPFKCKCGFRVK